MPFSAHQTLLFFGSQLLQLARQGAFLPSTNSFSQSQLLTYKYILINLVRLNLRFRFQLILLQTICKFVSWANKYCRPNLLKTHYPTLYHQDPRPLARDKDCLFLRSSVIRPIFIKSGQAKDPLFFFLPPSHHQQYSKRRFHSFKSSSTTYSSYPELVLKSPIFPIFTQYSPKLSMFFIY